MQDNLCKTPFYFDVELISDTGLIDITLELNSRGVIIMDAPIAVKTWCAKSPDIPHPFDDPYRYPYQPLFWDKDSWKLMGVTTDNECFMQNYPDGYENWSAQAKYLEGYTACQILEFIRDNFPLSEGDGHE